jgi:hypothetical protein
MKKKIILLILSVYLTSCDGSINPVNHNVQNNNLYNNLNNKQKNFPSPHSSLSPSPSSSPVISKNLNENNTLPQITFDEEIKVNSLDEGVHIAPKIVSDSKGNFIVIWVITGNGSNSGVYLKKYNKEGKLLIPEFKVNNDVSSQYYSPELVIDKKDRIIVTYQSNKGKDDDIYAKIFDTEGIVLKEEFIINTFTNSHQITPSISINNKNEFLIVWASVDQDGAAYGVFGKRFDENGNPIGSEFQVNTFTYNNQVQPKVSFDNEGNFIIVWQGQSYDMSNSEDIYAQFYNNKGEPIDKEIKVSNLTYKNNSYPSVAVNNSDEFIISWNGVGQNGYGTYSAKFNNLHKLENLDIFFDSVTNSNLMFDIDKENNILLIWRDLNGIYSQKFDSMGKKQSEKKLISINKTFCEYREPTLEINKDGNIMFIWETTFYYNDYKNYNPYSWSKIFMKIYDNSFKKL